MATQEQMTRLRDALTTEGHTVEIDQHAGHPSGSLAAASESARYAAELNSRGEHVARIMDGKSRSFECGVDVTQARELLAGGARFCGPDSMRP